VPEISRYKPSEAVEIAKKTTRGFLNFSTVGIRCLNNESMGLALLSGRGVVGQYSEFPDQSASIRMTIASATAIDEQSTDNFKLLLEPEATSREPFFAISIDRASAILQIPVYRKMEIKIAPYVLRIPLKFIKSLVKLFPSAEDLRMLQIDSDDPEDDTPEDMPPETLDAENPRNMFFQEFFFCPFQATLHVRRKDRGFAAEFNALSVQFKGIHIYDLHGTRQQLTKFVKTQFKKALWKSIPAMVLSKLRKQKTKEQ